MSAAAKIAKALAKNGRAMTLARLVGTGPSTISVTVYGVAQAFSPEQLQADLLQGDQRVTLSNAEIAAAAWPGPPARGDRIEIDGRSWNVRGCETKYLGAVPLAHVLHVRGG